MKNLNLLPVSEDARGRLERLAGMHKMYGGPVIDIGAVVGPHVLVLITYDKKDLSPEDLIDRARELFAGEIGKELELYFAINTSYRKHVPTADGRHVFRIDKGPFLAEVIEDNQGYLNAAGKRYAVRIVAGDPTPLLKTQLEQWIAMSINRDGVGYRPAPSLVERLEGARMIDDVLEDLFNTSPMPDGVRTYKMLHGRGELKQTGAIRIVEEFTDYRCVIVCVPK